MKLRDDQIREHFSKGKLLPLYILSGDEPLLMQETADLIRSEARKAGITERERFLVDAQFEWSHLLQAGNSMSLFGDRKLLEVRNDKGKFDDRAKKALALYCDDPNPDNILLLILPKVEKATLSAKWFQQLESRGALIQIWPIETARLPDWIHQRLRNAGLEPSRDATQLLAERVEGNLLAASQEVEKLILLRGPGPLDISDIESAVADHARYSLYDLVDEVLRGNNVHAIKILNFLRTSGIEPAFLLGVLSKEIRTLAGMASLMENGLAIGRAMEEYKIWSSRKALVQGILQRVPTRTFKHCLVEAARIDQAIKGLGAGNPWDGFINLILWLSGKVKPGLMALDT